jgi:hypothetical protein
MERIIALLASGRAWRTKNKGTKEQGNKEQRNNGTREQGNRGTKNKGTGEQGNKIGDGRIKNGGPLGEARTRNQVQIP